MPRQPCNRCIFRKALTWRPRAASRAQPATVFSEKQGCKPTD